MHTKKLIQKEVTNYFHKIIYRFTNRLARFKNCNNGPLLWGPFWSCSCARRRPEIPGSQWPRAPPSCLPEKLLDRTDSERTAADRLRSCAFPVRPAALWPHIYIYRKKSKFIVSIYKTF